MSKHETPLTEHFWQRTCPGAFIPEYPLARKSAIQGGRWADAVILPKEAHRRATRSEYPNLAGRDVVVVQTKARRMGMNVMGQAVFSARLIRQAQPKSLRSIILVTQNDETLLPLLSEFPEVEVWIADPKLQNDPYRVTA